MNKRTSSTLSGGMKALGRAAGTLAVLLAMGAAFACSNSFREVSLEVSNQRAINLSRYERVLYADLILENAPEGYDPTPELHTFFLKDMKQIIGKEIAAVPATGAQPEERIKAVTDATPDRKNTMLISGVLNFNVNSRSKIEDKENQEGKKERQFVKLEQWILTLDIRLTDLETGQTFFSNKYTDKISDSETNKAKYNFESVFFKLNNRFSRDITTIKRIQRRYLLSE